MAKNSHKHEALLLKYPLAIDIQKNHARPNLAFNSIDASIHTDGKRNPFSMKLSKVPDEKASYEAAEPPPSYPQAREEPAVDIRTLQPQPDAGSSTYPPQSHHIQAPSRLMHVMYENWRSSQMRLLDADKTNTLYTMKLQMRKPHITVEDASTGAAIGTANFHTFKSRIDITVHDTPIEFKSHGMLKSSYGWTSPALGGAAMSWKSNSWATEITCLNEHAVAIARFRFSNWSMKKCGTLEILGPQAAGGPSFDEVLVTGLAAVEVVLAMRNTSIAVGAA